MSAYEYTALAREIRAFCPPSFVAIRENFHVGFKTTYLNDFIVELRNVLFAEDDVVLDCSRDDVWLLLYISDGPLNPEFARIIGDLL
jgi:hypothetical protein